MATALTVQDIARTGLTPSFTSAGSAGNAVPNDGHTFVEIKNTSGSAATVTLDIPGTVDGQAVTDRTVTVGATTGDKMIGPFPPSIYNQDDGTVLLSFSHVTSLSIAAFRL
jgi:hypothetical protein